MSTQALTHEQEIHDRIAREKAARESKPPIQAGSIVLVGVPGSRETGGEPMTVPAIVIYQDLMTRDLRLSAFHLGGLFHMAGVSPDLVEVVLAPLKSLPLGVDVKKLEDTLGEVFARLDALEAPRTASKPSKG